MKIIFGKTRAGYAWWYARKKKLIIFSNKTGGGVYCRIPIQGGKSEEQIRRIAEVSCPSILKRHIAEQRQFFIKESMKLQHDFFIKESMKLQQNALVIIEKRRRERKDVRPCI